MRQHFESRCCCFSAAGFSFLSFHLLQDHACVAISSGLFVLLYVGFKVVPAPFFLITFPAILKLQVEASFHAQSYRR